MELTKLLKRLGKICLWTSVCLLVVLILLYFARIPLSISLLESSGKDQALYVECLDWHLTLTPSIQIDEVCLSSNNAKLTASDISWAYLNRTLDIQQLTVNHIRSKQAEPNDSSSLNLDGFVLPANIPLIQVNNLIIDSYLFDKPFALSIKQDSANSMLIAGDLDARINLLSSDSGNSLQAKINWIPNKIITAIPQIKAIMVDVDPYLGLQHWKNAPISSEFKFVGTTLYSSHKLAIQEQLNYEDCSLDISFAGKFETLTSTDDLTTEIDLNQLPITFGVADCDKLRFLSEDLATKYLTLLVENPVEVTPTELKLTEVRVEDSLSSARFSALLQNAEFQLKGKNQSKGQFQAHIDLPYKSSSVSAEIKAALSGEFNGEAEDIFITVNTDNFELNNVSFSGEATAQTDKVIGNAKGQFHSGVFEASGKISSKDIHIVRSPESSENSKPTVVMKSLESLFRIEESKLQEVKLVLTNKISKVSYEGANIAQINNQTSVVLSHLNELDISASSEIRKSQMADISVKSIAIEHKLRAIINSDDNAFTSQSVHEFKTDSGIFGSLLHAVREGSNMLNIELPEQSILPLQPQLSIINRETTLKSGQFAGSLQYDIGASLGKGSLSLKELNVDFDDYKIRGVNMDERFTLNSAELQLPDAKVLIDSVDVGVPINNIVAVISAKENAFKLQEAKGSIFGGQFILGEFWLDGRDQELKISAADLSLAELAALQQQSGINVTGEIGGNLPLLITASGFNIDKGTLTSEQPGTLKIKDNPAFDSIKNSQPQLALLENLNYEKLETNVSLTPDGWLKMDFSILGSNPDKNQAVNFNYGHEENIFTLLKALRITNSVQQGLEKKIENKYLNKNNTNKGNQ